MWPPWWGRSSGNLSPTRGDGGWNEKSCSAKQLALEGKKPSSSSSSSDSSSSNPDSPSAGAPQAQHFPPQDAQQDATMDREVAPKHNASHHKMPNKMLPWIVKLPRANWRRKPPKCKPWSMTLKAWAGEGKCSDWWPKEAHWRPDRGECHLMWSGGIGPWQRGSSQVSCRNVGSFAVFTKDELATSPRSTSRWDGHQSLIAGKVLYAARCVKVFLPLHPLLQTSSGKQYQPLFKRPCSFFSLSALLTLNAGYFWEPATKWPRVCLFAWLACEKRPWKQPRRNWSLEMVGVGWCWSWWSNPHRAHVNRDVTYKDAVSKGKCILWEQWSGLLVRGKPEMLILIMLTPTLSVRPAPGPDAIHKADRTPSAEQHPKDRKIVPHTDSAKS